jgi:hypothetical protein
MCTHTHTRARARAFHLRYYLSELDEMWHWKFALKIVERLQFCFLSVRSMQGALLYTTLRTKIMDFLRNISSDKKSTHNLT